MKNKKCIVYLVVSILVLTIEVSYAYFKARVNGEGNSIINNIKWLTMSPGMRVNSSSHVFYIEGSTEKPGYIFEGGGLIGNNAVRPVVSISKCAKVKSGIGTPLRPYEIDENSCS